jgi:hypothetical protein
MLPKSRTFDLYQKYTSKSRENICSMKLVQNKDKNEVDSANL